MCKADFLCCSLQVSIVLFCHEIFTNIAPSGVMLVLDKTVNTPFTLICCLVSCEVVESKRVRKKVKVKVFLFFFADEGNGRGRPPSEVLGTWTWTFQASGKMTEIKVF
jgi:hypothetical protein